MLDPKTKELVAIAAAVVAKCHPCLDYHMEEARKAGVSDSEMENAVSIARSVRTAGKENMDKYVDTKLDAAAVSSACACSNNKCCG